MTHYFTINGCHIALDVHSGAVHILDDLVNDILTGDIASLETRYSKEEIAEAQAEIDALIACGQLNSKLPSSSRATEIAFTQNRKPVVKALCMHIAHDCNLRCTYCFAGEGDYGAISRTLMSAEVGKKAIDFLIANSGNRSNLEVDFFGGEPTLNFEVVKTIVEYAREQEMDSGKNFRFTLTTNGLLLDDEKINYINSHMDNVVLSLDGRKEINDKMRKSKNAGASCYDIVLPKFKKLVEARKHQNYYMRGTYTGNNLDFCNDVLHMANLGFSQISVEPVIGSATASYSIRNEDVLALCEEYERLAIEMVNCNYNFNFFHFMLDMTNGPCAAKRITGCGAGTEYLAVTPEGDLYPCHQFVGDKEFRLGDLDSGISANKWQEQFDKCNVYTKPECDTCWAKYFCSGGCAANAFHVNGDIMKPDEIGCRLQKKRLECALYLQCFVTS
ncbi:MAG: thioether cross-link-forming SCIFF peptide maturase [Defluviitaleaceae bacterium]|nr:thioether cross-link-forming SCIFF peptide maturase [Defluviitaleaceae bacterium]